MILNVLKRIIHGEKISEEERLKLLNVGYPLDLVDKMKGIGKDSLVQMLQEILKPSKTHSFSATLDKLRSEEKPVPIIMIGINGVGKTTTAAKLSYLLMRNGLSVSLCCADTYRAASIEQLGYHAKNLNIKYYHGKYGEDPAAVAFNAFETCDSDVLIIDTAGRMHTNKLLIDELVKVINVFDKKLTILVLDALCGNVSINQAKMFLEACGFDFIIIAKVDANPYTGVVVGASFVTNKPISHLGVGQDYKDLVPFDPETYINDIIKYIFQ